MRIAKTLINETVRLKKEAIWEPFEAVEAHPNKDQRLKKWILILLKNPDSKGTTETTKEPEK